LVLSEDSSFIKNALVGISPGANHKIVNHLDERDVEILPYHTARLVSYVNENNNLDTITLKFSDVSNKCVLTLDEIDTLNEEINIICDKNEEVVINTKDFCRRGVFESWQDFDGNIISKEEEFCYTVIGNTTIYLKTKKFDISTEYKGVQFYFQLNDDDTLSLINFSFRQADMVEIPNVVEGKIVTTIGLLHYKGFGGNLIIPDSVIFFEPNAFKYLGIDGYYKPTISFSSERKDLNVSDFYGCNDRIMFNFNENTISGMVTNELHKLANNDVNINVIFANEMEEGILGFYTQGSQNITIQKLPEGSVYNRNILNVIVHELRHYYQAISIGDVVGLSVDNLKVTPSDNEVGAWKYLEYTQSSEDYNKYYYNAREVDSREYAELITGFDL
jgi:hypothetical protein